MNDREADRMARMRAALLAASQQFHTYADYHLAKRPPDREKAAINIHWAMVCYEAAGSEIDPKA